MLKNQIPTTKIVLPAYQNILCVISKKEFPEISIRERKKIRSIFNNKKDEKEKNSIKILFLTGIFGIDKFKINKRTYAEPATQEFIISIGKLPAKITFETIEA
ncbi:MAG: hypothetical protein M1416_01685 [Candidatus Pacearchaeota archaeon]|nr:hypothetical protein [Candidatus Pacearchaeota archaeon]